MKKIGIFGGTFDPVHNAHIAVALKAVQALSLDRLIFVVAGQPPHKSGDYRTLASHRLEMVRLAVSGIEKIEVSDYEIKKRGKSYSYLTAQHFKKLYPDAELYFVIGDEAYRELPTWRCPEKLSALVKFAVVTRDGGSIDPNCIHITIPPIDISSTEIRESLRRGGDVSQLLPAGVLNYIKENDLYKG